MRWRSLLDPRPSSCAFAGGASASLLRIRSAGGKVLLRIRRHLPTHGPGFCVFVGLAATFVGGARGRGALVRMPCSTSRQQAVGSIAATKFLMLGTG